jgi:hypothetical protein
MFKLLYSIAAVAYNFLDMFSLYTAVFTFTGIGLIHFLSGGDSRWQ